MSQRMKPVFIPDHARDQLADRGGSVEEVEEAVRNASRGPAKLNRLECRMNFSYNDSWRGKYYQTKQIRPVFVEEEAQIVIVTVYVYYF